MLQKTLLLATGITIVLLSACNKNSNELAPIKSKEQFDKTVTYNGSTFLTVKVEQVILYGDDTLKIIVKNSHTSALKDLHLATYFQLQTGFDEAMNNRTDLYIDSLPPGKDTTFIVYDHPSLPVTEEKIFIKLISETATNSNIMARMYDGNVGYYFDDDTLAPTSYGFVKGIIEADGKSTFWLKLNSLEKKITGNFIDTLGLNNGFLFQETHQFTAELDTIQPGTHFIDNGSYINFRLNIGPPQDELEKKIKFTLYK